MAYRKAKYHCRNGYEESIRMKLERAKIPFDYESTEFFYQIPIRKYIPDFRIVTKSGKIIYIEAKGYFSPEDRMKMLWVRDQNRDADFRLVFQNANNKLKKGSKTSYGQWATTHCFLFAEGKVPQEWLDE